MQTERAKRMDSAGEEAYLNSPELPWNQLYLKRIQLRRRVCFTGPAAAAAVTGVLAILILAAGSVSSDSEFVKVPSSVKCTEGQDCILSCTFNYTAVRWDEKSAVIWRQAETHDIVHRYYNNTDRLDDQLAQYVNRTSLFVSELQRGNASLLLRRVREEDAREYMCSVNASPQLGSSKNVVILVSAQPRTAAFVNEHHAWWGLGVFLCVIAGLCVKLCKKKTCRRWKPSNGLKSLCLTCDHETQLSQTAPLHFNLPSLIQAPIHFKLGNMLPVLTRNFKITLFPRQLLCNMTWF